MTCGLSAELAAALRNEVERNKVASVETSVDEDVGAKFRYTIPSRQDRPAAGLGMERPLPIWDKKPVTDNPGGLNGSTQHLPNVLSYGSRTLISFVGVNSNKTQALFRF